MTPASSTLPSDAEVIALDPKALEAAMRAFDNFTKAVYDEFHMTARVKEHTSAIVQAYLSSASKAALPEEVAECIAWLGDAVDHEDDSDQRKGLRKAAALLSALASRAQTWNFDMDAAPKEEAVILATWGAWVGEAILQLADAPEERWVWHWAGRKEEIHPRLRPIAWRPLPAHPEKPNV